MNAPMKTYGPMSVLWNVGSGPSTKSKAQTDSTTA